MPALKMSDEMHRSFGSGLVGGNPGRASEVDSDTEDRRL
jgi:hypothetical protein